MLGCGLLLVVTAACTKSEAHTNGDAAVFGVAPATTPASTTTMELSQNGITILKVQTDATGAYRLDHIGAGHYTLTMDAVGEPSPTRCDGTRFACVIPPERAERRIFDLDAGTQHREDFE